MLPLTLDDLIPLEEYASRRREYFDSHRRYLDRYRRVRIGPLLTLIFENRQTLWFRIQEILRIARVTDQARVQQELDLYNRLLPARNRLQAALILDVDETRLVEELERWKDWEGKDLRLQLRDREYPATVVTCRPEDRCVGTAQWVQFQIDDDGRRLLSDLTTPSRFVFQTPAYDHQSNFLGEDLRQSLLDDLTLSDRHAS